MVLGTIVHYCREVPLNLWRRLKSRFIIEIDIPDRDEAFLWMDEWLSSHPYGRNRARLLTVRTIRPYDEDERTDRRPRILFTPAPGAHWFFFKRRLVILNRSRTNISDAKSSLSGALRESFNILIFTRNRQLVQQLIEEARELVHPEGEKKVGILTAKYGHWNSKMMRRPRPLESIVLRQGFMEELVATVEKFRDNEQWCNDRGIPWRLGIELYGPPGSGKSSAVMGVASHFGMDIAILNLASASMDDDELYSLLANVDSNTIVLIEDIDCVYNQREASEDKDNRITFSGLLNAIDGVSAGEGRILFVTTNHPEKLDPALVRPGRIDLKLEVGHPDADQIYRLFQRFYPSASHADALHFVEAVKTPERSSMAALQGLLTKYSHSPNLAIQNVGEIYHVEPASSPV